MTRHLKSIRTTFLAFALLVVGAPCVWAETYDFDRVHTQILFFVDHLGLSKSQGEFLDFDGWFTFKRKDFESSQVELVIQTASIDMDDEKWNKWMRGKKYFHTERYPTMTFISTRIEAIDEHNAVVHGNLTLLDTTRPIQVNMRFNKTGINPLSAKMTAGFSGNAQLRRTDFGMNSHLKWVGDEVEIRLEVEGILRKPTTKNDR